MQPIDGFVVYFSNEETAFPYTHNAIDRDQVDLSKSNSNGSLWILDRTQDVGSLPPHRGVELSKTLGM